MLEFCIVYVLLRSIPLAYQIWRLHPTVIMEQRNEDFWIKLISSNEETQGKSHVIANTNIDQFN